MKSKATKMKQAETTYSIAELAEHSEKIFGANVKKECVMAALQMKELNEASVVEAKEIVEAFLKREVI